MKPLKYLSPELRLLNFRQNHLEPEAGDRGWSPVSTTIKKIDEKGRRVHAVLSHIATDRYGEIVLPRAYEPWQERFRQNPVLLSGHDHSRQTGHWEEMVITPTTLEGWAVFDANDEDAKKDWNLIAGKHRRGFSVGFIGHKWEMLTRPEIKRLLEGSVPDDQIPGDDTRRRVWTSAEHIEGSSVAVPAAPGALSQMLRSMVEGGEGSPLILRQGVDFKPDMEAIAKAIFEDGSLRAGINEHITKLLTDPCGPVASLISDVVAAVKADGSCHTHSTSGGADDVPEPGSAAGKQAELEKALKKLAGA